VLAAANKLKNPNVLRIGQALAVPGSTWRCPVAGPRQFSDDFAMMRASGGAHEGNDIFAAAGTPVVAPVSGVIEQRVGAIGGNAFYLNGDDGVRYYGAHLSAFKGNVGRVAQGTVIGLVGNTGDAIHTSSHLHFEVHPGGGLAVNPYPSLKKWC
jgi:murein DD-endopeptidase MepM/ murein hydrolase activator NlpD